MLRETESKNQAGFSIVELLVTLVIIGTTFSAFMVTFTTIQSTNKKSLDISQSNNIAFQKIQQYENTIFTSLPNTSPIGSLQMVEDFSSELPSSLESPRVGQVFISTQSSTLKQIVVNITFGSGEGQRQIEYASLIQNNGLGR
jgi:prepilin-type N-terminal cleavage/methylation domain-containing protein